jgi:hypothetical protein
MNMSDSIEGPRRSLRQCTLSSLEKIGSARQPLGCYAEKSIWHGHASGT